MPHDIPPVPEGTNAPFAGLAVEFVGSFPDPTTHLDPVLPEVAFIGRSNVGKSSLLNALTGRKGLARVSATPGKTQTMNVFRLPAFYLIDLPGYGFAKASKVNRAAYRKLVEGYLTKRPTLAGVVWLLDSRHEPSKDDLAFQELLAGSGRPALAVLTKADKLTRSEQGAQPRAIAGALGLPEDQVQLVSSTDGMGIADLGASILTAIQGESA
jgi:GTP-binding protein